MGGLPWLKLDVDAATHPKVLHLEALLGVPDAFGIVCRLWSWTSKYAGDGLIPNKAKDQMAAWVARGIPAVSALDAMVEAGCLDRRKDGLVVHGWSEYQGEHVKFRERNTERQRKLRERNALLTRDTTVSNASVTRAEERRGEKNREDQKPSATRKRAQREETKTGASAVAYSDAFFVRYGVRPFKDDRPDRTANSLLAQLVDKLGAEDAPGVAQHFIASNEKLYVVSKHPLNLLCRDYVKLRAEWLGAKRSTSTEAGQIDRTQSNLTAIHGAAERLKEKNRGVV